MSSSLTKTIWHGIKQLDKNCLARCPAVRKETVWQYIKQLERTVSGLSLQYAYLGETGTEEESGSQQQNTKPRKTLKDKLFLIYNFASNASYMFAPGKFVSVFDDNQVDCCGT